MKIFIHLKIFTVVFLTMISNYSIYGQTNDTWTVFYNQDSTLVGYKDKSGVVKIEPKFAGFVTAIKFCDIIAGSERDKEKWTSYYLNKKGGEFGRDSIYIFDNVADCENEGFIRFRDRKSDKVGLFDKNGEIVVPAIYNDLTKVRNGMLVGLKGAKKKYVRENEPPADNYYTWVGGVEVLLDTLNKVLAENFPNDNKLDFYSVERTSTPSEDKSKKSFPASDGKYVTFIDFKKEFKTWLIDDLLSDFTRGQLLHVVHDTIVWESKEGWARSEKQEFVDNNFQLLKQILSEINESSTNYSIFLNGLNPFIYEGAEFDKYFNNCREAKEWQYPVLSVVISYDYGTADISQNHFDFLRTENGYKLISVTIRNAEIKE
ncbi:WG repeat-containing protein [Sphingobacterium corticibacterium]|nr:WG repeat-containing protein [Sphingobacterium corticibacterium]